VALQDAGLKESLLQRFRTDRAHTVGESHTCPPYREHRLYQCSFLLRDYGFKANSIAQILDDQGILPNTDPKLALAKANQSLLPINLNEASFYEILRIPKIGLTLAKRIMRARENTKIRYFKDLEKAIGAGLTRKISPYVELGDKRLTDFLRKVNKDNV